MKNLLNKKEIPSSVDYTIVALNEDGNVTVKGKKVVPEGYVDLGLPSGLKWAKCNVGATSEEEYGKYFQWGDTVGYTDASYSTWETAPFNNDSSSYDSAYFASVKDTVCPNGVLASQYDAASVNMGDSWRMPTKEDFEELKSNTISSWATIKNVNGYKFTSKSDPTKYIFIPAAGYAGNGSVNMVGSSGYVWSSSLHSTSPRYASCLNIYPGGASVGQEHRYNGYSVRGVLE